MHAHTPAHTLTPTSPAAGAGLRSYPCVNSQACNVQHRWSTGLPYWRGLPNSACVADHADRPWLCLLGEVAFRYVRTRTLPMLYSSDLWQAGMDGVYHKNLTTQERAWVEKRVSEVLLSLQVDSPRSVFVAACLFHVLTANTDVMFDKLSVGGVSAAEAVRRFVDGEEVYAVDTCQGVGCNPTCAEAGAVWK